MAVTSDVFELRKKRPVAEVEAPQLRTLLLTDICDSTELVERIGDVRAAELFREHDRLVLRLQQLWRGRLIDRSDGLLLLFERPVDGLAFALDYLAGIGQLGKSLSLSLKARAGLHVGEVLTWQNSKQAIAGGAKQLEVEGLAKPMAARLMSLARPNQILLSAVAESLTRRATRELGERGERLLWKSHGRWRFKGVPMPQQVYEVGEISTAPLRMPKQVPKARRDIPLWRRPSALILETSLLLVAAIGLWFMFKPAPAIAFSERDWVVVGDLRNLTGDKLLDDSLRQAFLISLGQSRYVNVIPELKVEDTLRRMNLDPTTAKLDLKTGTEVAIRDGAKALLMPSVVEVGGKLRVSVDIFDPGNGNKVLSVYQDGKGLASALGSVDSVATKLRDQFGESVASINGASSPLPEVTTPSLDALKAYAMGKHAEDHRKFRRAIDYYQQAIAFDNKFAMAYLSLAYSYDSIPDSAQRQASLNKATSLRERLPKREQLYLDAWQAYNSENLDEADQKFKLLVEMYPDHFDALQKYAWLLASTGNYQAVEKYASNGLKEQNPKLGALLKRLGYAELGLGKTAAAITHLTKSDRILELPPGYSSSLGVAASGNGPSGYNQFVQSHADKPLDRSDAVRSIAMKLQLEDYAGASSDADNKARSELASVAHDYDAEFFSRLYEFIGLSVGVAAGKPASAAQMHQFFEKVAHAAEGRGSYSENDAYLALATYYLIQRSSPVRVNPGELSKVREVVARSHYLPLKSLMNIVDANQLLVSHQPKAALDMLSRNYRDVTFFQANVVRCSAYQQLKLEEDYKHCNRQLASMLPQAYADVAGAYALQPLNVADAMHALHRLH